MSLWPNRYDILNEIRQLDPKTDNYRITNLTGAWEFPWLTLRALEFALFRTYAVPSISKLLDSTGQFEKYGQRRYDDTSLIIAEIGEHGIDSERGRAAIRRMNQIHRRFNIANDDYLYVLSTFIYEPIRWNDRFGWRKLIDVEKLAGYYFWAEVGKLMHIQNIPPSYAAFEQFNIDYEREYFRYTASNYRVGEATIKVFLKWYPAPIRPLVREGIYALIDEPLREAFGFPKAHSSMMALVESGMNARSTFVRMFFPPRRKPWYFTTHPNRTYPNGYEIENLGPIHHDGDSA